MNLINVFTLDLKSTDLLQLSTKSSTISRKNMAVKRKKREGRGSQVSDYGPGFCHLFIKSMNSLILFMHQQLIINFILKFLLIKKQTQSDSAQENSQLNITPASVLENQSTTARDMLVSGRIYFSPARKHLRAS